MLHGRGVKTEAHERALGGRDNVRAPLGVSGAFSGRRGS
jgi:hypothetical protein